MPVFFRSTGLLTRDVLLCFSPPFFLIPSFMSYQHLVTWFCAAKALLSSGRVHHRENTWGVFVLYPPISHRFKFLFNTTKLSFSFSSFCCYLNSRGWGPERSWQFYPLMALAHFLQGSSAKDKCLENTKVQNGQKQLRVDCGGGEASLVMHHLIDSLLIRFLVEFMQLPHPFYYWLSAVKRELGLRIELFGRTKQTNHRHCHLTTSNDYGYVSRITRNVRNHSFSFLFKVLSLYLTERERERAQAGGLQREREKQTSRWAGSPTLGSISGSCHHVPSWRQTPHQLTPGHPETLPFQKGQQPSKEVRRGGKFGASWSFRACIFTAWCWHRIKIKVPL